MSEAHRSLKHARLLRWGVRRELNQAQVFPASSSELHSLTSFLGLGADAAKVRRLALILRGIPPQDRFASGILPRDEEDSLMPAAGMGREHPNVPD